MNERLGNVEFLVRRGDIRDVRFVAAPTEYQIDLASDQVLLKIAKFGFTSNNVTYATLGEAMRYWDFFPAPEGWGRVPVWGYADVARSAHPEIAEGERVSDICRCRLISWSSPDRSCGADRDLSRLGGVS